MTGYGFVVNLVYVGPWSLLGFSMVIGSFFLLVSTIPTHLFLLLNR